MKLVIIVDDGAVYVDGVSYSGLDLSMVPSGVHALQWDGVFGEIEFKRALSNGEFVHPANQTITELPEWANQAKIKWDEAKVIAETPPVVESIEIPVVDVTA